MKNNAPCRFSASEQRSQAAKRAVQCPMLCSNLMAAAFWTGAVLPCASTLALTGRDCSRIEAHFTFFSILLPFSDHFFFPHLLPTSLISFLFHLMLSDCYQSLCAIIQTFRYHLDILAASVTEVALDSWDLSLSSEKCQHLTIILNCITVLNTSPELSTFIRCSLSIFSGDGRISIISTLRNTQMNWSKTMQFFYFIKWFVQDYTGFQSLYHLSSCNKIVVLQSGIIVSLLSK